MTSSRVFVAGASGALGQHLLPLLVEAGYDVAGMMRSEANMAEIRAAGAMPVVADGLERARVIAAVQEFRPDVIVHQMTALKGLGMRTFARDFEITNRLRTDGTDTLLEAGRQVGIRRFVAQSFAGWPLARSGTRLKTEDEPLDPSPAGPMRAAAEAIAYCEQATLSTGWTEGVVLRYGTFYGPGTGLAPGGEQLDLLRRRRWPLIGDSAGIWSFIHVEDAAAATLAAIERGSPGIYHVVEDDPPSAAEWLPVVAQRIGAPPPLRIPRLIARIVGGEAATVIMTEAHGASNAKAKRELAWQPAHNWRTDLGR